MTVTPLWSICSMLPTWFYFDDKRFCRSAAGPSQYFIDGSLCFTYFEPKAFHEKHIYVTVYYRKNSNNDLRIDFTVVYGTDLLTKVYNRPLNALYNPVKDIIIINKNIA